MKELLNQIEAFLQDLIEDNSHRLLGSSRLENELIKQIINAMGEQIRTDTQSNLTAPHIFSLNVPYDYAEDIRSNQNLLDNLALNLMKAGLSSGIHFDGKITITVFPDSTIKEGEFKIRAIWKDEKITETHPYETHPANLLSSLQQPKAFLIVGGTQIYTLEDDIINIGRNLDNDLVVNDPRVSRKHGQIRVIKGRHMLFDLGSSGGTFVNNKRIQQIALHPGDVLSLAGVPLVYGQDAISHIDETKEYSPPPSVDSSSSTSLKFNTEDSDSTKEN
jgi:hypothetical protein